MKPPRWLDWLLSWLIAPDRREEILGDLHEEFAYQAGQSGERWARWRYAWEALGFIRFFAIRHQSGPYSSTSFLHPVMLQNYFKIALRNLQKNKVTGLINLLGLTLGLTCCLIIAA